MHALQEGGGGGVGLGLVRFRLSSILTPTGPALPQWAKTLQSRDFQLLCRDGSKAEVTAWRTCHLARVPAHAVVTRLDMDGDLIFQLLNQGQVGLVLGLCGSPSWVPYWLSGACAAAPRSEGMGGEKCAA